MGTRLEDSCSATRSESGNSTTNGLYVPLSLPLLSPLCSPYVSQSFMSWNEFCFRACKDGPNAPHLCNHIYDTLGCQWNMPADYSNNAFDSCQGDTGLPMGIYGTSTFRQGQPATPGAHPKPATSSCITTASLTQIAPAAATPASAGGPVVTVFTSGTVAITATFTPTTTAVASAAATTVASKSGASLTSSASWFGIAAAVVGAFVAL